MTTDLTTNGQSPASESTQEFLKLLEDALHDSRPVGSGHDRDRETALLDRIQPLYGFDEPEPLQWFVKDLIPRGFVTILAADGGTGKSYLSLYLALCVLLERPFFGQDVSPGTVLVVDCELDVDEQRRRLVRVLAGLGMDRHAPAIQDRFEYYRLENPLSKDAGHDEVLAVIEETGADLVILDSLTLAIAEDASSQREVVRAMRRFKEWGTVLAIDHISGASASGNQANARPFGSVFKRNIARSVLMLSKADGGGLMLRANKANFGPPSDLVCFEMEFSDHGRRVDFHTLSMHDEAMVGAASHLKTHEITRLAVETLSVDVTAQEVVVWRDDHGYPHAAEGTVRNHFTRLRRDGHVVLQDGRAYPPGFVEGEAVGTPVGSGVIEEGARPETGKYPVKLDASGEVRYFEPDQITARHDSRSRPLLTTVNRESRQMELGEVQ